MSTPVAETIEIYFDPIAATFTLDDSTKGKLDDTTYLLGGIGYGGFPSDVTPYVTSFSFFRGRSRELDVINSGQLWMSLNNYDGRFTPDNFTNDPAPTYGVGAVTVGRKIRVMVAGVVVFDGWIQSWLINYDEQLRATVAIVADDNLAALARMRFQSWTATGSQTAGTRLGAILDRSEVDWGPNRSLDTGVSTLQGDSVSYGSNVLNYCQLVAQSDFGRFFADRQGVITFKDRHNLVNPTVVVTFTDDPATVDGIGFREATPTLSSELLYTDVSVDREGGTAQLQSDATAREMYGIRRLDITGLLLDSDAQSLDMAGYLNGIYKQPQPRISGLTVRLDGLSSPDQATVATLDIGQVVRVYWTPRAVNYPVDYEYAIEGISHYTQAGGPHDVVLQLTPVFQAEAFVLDDTLLGELDAGVLAF